MKYGIILLLLTVSSSVKPREEHITALDDDVFHISSWCQIREDRLPDNGCIDRPGINAVVNHRPAGGRPRGGVAGKRHRRSP